MLNRIIIVFITLFMTACAQTHKGVHSDDISFIKKIQQGGYVIFFRHAATDHSQDDTDKKNLADCSKQRRLNGLGKTQAKVIGKSFKKLKIPVGEIISSEYCRCINTAKLAFGRPQTTLDISSYIGVTLKERTRRIQVLRDMLTIVPEEGTNTIIVGHKGMFKEASGVLLQEGEAAIFKPNGNGTTKLITQVKPDGWQKIGTNYSKL